MISNQKAPDPREVCKRCRRPGHLCYCAHLPSLPTRARIVILQHPRERRVPIGTARMAHLALPNSELHSGIEFENHARIRALREEQGTHLLFPGEGALDPSQLEAGQLKHLIVIDGTWAQARKVLKLNPALRELPRIGLKPEQPGNYRIRLEPSAECLATIEAVSGVLGVLENDKPKFDGMLAAFTFMVDQQLLHRAGNREHRGKRKRLRAISDEEKLFVHRDELVFVHAEVNAHARSLNVPGRPELLHLVARRSSGEEFRATLCPRRPLAVNAPMHLGVPEEKLRAGESIEAVRARWQRFVRDGDLHCGWGHFTRDQLAFEELSTAPYIDMRLVLARRLQSRPGAPEEAIAKLDEGSDRREIPLGDADRASRVVAALAILAGRLQPDRK